MIYFDFIFNIVLPILSLIICIYIIISIYLEHITKYYYCSFVVIKDENTLQLNDCLIKTKDKYFPVLWFLTKTKIELGLSIERVKIIYVIRITKSDFLET